MSVLAAALVVVSGFFIGAVAIGGVLVVPALTEAAGVPLDRAIAAAMAGFAFTGIAALVFRRGRSDASAGGAWALNLAALGGAVLGALAVAVVPEAAIRLLIGAIAIVSGLHALAPGAAAERVAAVPGRPALAAIGGVVGAGSALSGTGGPVLLLPILLLLGVPVRNGIALAQLVQLPIALSATAVNAAQGRLDFGLAGLAGAFLVLGSLAGLWLGSRVGTATLKRIVALGLVALGLWYGHATFVDGGAP
jgi:hypothetical protein